MNAISYIKNVGKSFGYVAVDVFKEMNPAITSMIETNKDIVESAYEAIKDLKGTSNSTKDKFVKNDYVQLVPEALSNLKEDLKSGKWYNKERKEQIDSDIMKSMGFDFDFDDFGDFDDSFDDINLEDDDNSMKETLMLQDTMDTVGEKVANSVNTATVRSAEYVANVTQQSTRISMRHSSALFSKVQQGLLSINTSIASITPIIEPLNSHMQNSALFYTKSTELQEKQVELLKNIAKNTAPIEKKSSNISSNGNTINDLLTAEGALDIGNYANMVKKNVKDLLSMYTGIGDVFKDADGNGENMFRTIISSPMEFLIGGMMKSLIPKSTKKATEKFNDSLGGIFGSLLMKISEVDYSKGPAFQKISELLGINTSMKKSISSSGYEKGRVDFDGITRKSIIEVIPTYLSKIYSAVSGKEESRYDYDRGTFVNRKDIERENRYIVESEVHSTGYDINSEFSKYIAGRSNQNELQKTMNQFIEKVIMSAKFYNPNDEQAAYEFGLNNENGEVVTKFLKEILNDNSKSHLLTNLNTQALYARNNISNKYKSLERVGNSVISSLYNRSFDKSNDVISGSPLDFNNMRDEYDNNVFFYLQGLYQFTEAIYKSGGGGRGGKRSKGPIPIKPFQKKKKDEENKKVKHEAVGKSEYDDIVKSIKDKRLINKLSEDEKSWEYYNSLSEKEQEELISKLLRLKREQREIDETDKNLFDKIKKSEKAPQGLKDLAEKIDELRNKPAEFMNSLLGKTTKSINSLLYGSDKEDDENKGLLASILEKTNKMFEKFSTWSEEHIFKPLGEKFDALTEKLDKVIDNMKYKFSKFFDNVKSKLFGEKDEDGNRVGGMFSGVMNKTKENFKGVKSWVKNAFGSVFKGNREEPSAADGGVVSKGGMIAVSEGELIIPSEYNPYYNKATNKAKQIKDEHNAFKKFYGFYNDGGTVGEDETIKDKFKNVVKNAGKRARQRATRKAKQKAKQAADDAADAASEKFNEFKDKAMGTKEKPTLFRQILDEFKLGTETLFKKLFGPIGKEDEEEKGINKFIKKAMKEIGVPDNISGMLTGGVIGAGASLLTGGIVSPLMGAALGSAAGLIIKSKNVQEALFGEEDEDGNKKGGLLSKELSNFITKKIPGMAKTGIVGAGLSLIPGIPGGPIAGLLVGSAIGYVQQTESVKEKLFGAYDYFKGEKGAGKELAERLKKAMPRIGAGALAGLLVGPFGITGNLLVGSAIGFASTSDKFQDALFGEERDGNGGLVGWIKEKIFKPIGDLTKPLVQTIKNTIKSFGKSVSRHLYNMFKESIGIPLYAKLKESILDPLSKVTKGIFKKLSKLNPLKILTNIGKGLRSSQFQKGTASDMSAKERIAFRNKNNMGRDKTSQLDELLAQMNEQDITTWSDKLNKAQENRKETYRNLSTNLSGMSNQMLSGGVSVKHTKVIMNLIKKQKYDDVQDYLRKNAINFTPDQIEKIQNVIKSSRVYNDEYREKVGTSEDELGSLYKEFGDKFGVNINEKNAWRYQDLLKNEMKNRQKYEKGKDIKTETESTEEAIDETRVQVVTRMDRIISAVEKMAGIASNTKEKAGELATKTVNKAVDVKNNIEYTVKPKIEDTVDDISNKTNELVNRAKNFIYRNSPTGGLVKQKLNSQGERIDDTSDKESQDIIEQEKESISTNKGILAKIGGISLGFTGLMSKLFGQKDGDEKEGGIFGFLKNIFGGENGLLSKFTGFTKFFTGNGNNGFLTSGLGQLLQGIVGPALFVAAFSGKFDGIVNSISKLIKSNDPDNGKQGQYTNENVATVKDENGNTVYIQTDKDGMAKTDENGNYIGLGGETVEPNSNVNYKTSGRTFSSRLKEQTARGITTGTVKNTMLGKATKGISNIVKRKSGATGEAISKITKSAGDKAITSTTAKVITDNISDCIQKWANALKKLPMLSKYADSIDNMAASLYINVGDAIEKNSGKLAKIAGVASTFAWVAKIAFIAVDFSTGYQDARTTLGIVDEPTTGQRILSGLIRTIKNLIPFIGALIPDKTLVNIFAEYLAPAMGINMEELTAQRQKAKDTVEKYNEEHDTDYSIEDYNKQVLGDWTWTEKIGNGVKSTFKNIKQKGLGKTIADSKAGKAVSGAWDTVKGTAGKIGNSVRTTFTNGMDLSKYTKSGDITGLWSHEITDDKGDSLGRLFKVINFGQKVLLTPYTAISWVGHKIFNSIKQIGSDVKEIFIASKDSFISGWNTIHSVDENDNANGSLSDFLNMDNISISEDNMFGGLGKGIAVAGRVVSLPIAFIASIGKRIGKFAKNIVNKVSTGFRNIISNGIDLGKYTISGDVSGLWSHDIEDDKENPLGGIYKAINTIQKLMLTPSTAISWVGHKIWNGVKSTKDKVITSFSNMNKNAETLKQYSNSGDISGLWSNDIEDDNGNPLGGVYKAINTIQKVIFTPTTLIHLAGSKIHEKFDQIKTGISNDNNTSKEKSEQIKNYAMDGDISSIWKVSAKFDKNNPLRPFYNIIFNINKVIYTIIGAIKKIFEPIEEAIGGIINKAKDIANNAKEKVTNAKNTVVNGITNAASSAWNGITNFVTGSGSGINGHISQVDSRYASQPFSGTNVREQGCGPAAAAMAVNAAKGNGNVTMEQAINYANNNGFVSNDGTSSDYFGSMFNSQGLDSSYSMDKNNIAAEISSGNPTVLLGQDSTNTSKSNSPFGTGSHYVLARGFDNNGNIIIDDPEDKTGNKKYNKNILKNVKLGITARANGSRIGKKINRFRNKNRVFYGGASDNREIVWAFLKSKGATDNAAAAIIGNLMQESGCNPSLVQGNGKGPAAGIVQWENINTKQGRWKAMADYCASKGCDWTDIKCQLEYLWKELTYEDKLEPTWNVSYCKRKFGYSNYGMGFVTSNSDIDTLVEQFCNGFERAGTPMMDKRKQHARQAYNDFSGKTVSMDFSSSSTSTSSETNVSNAFSSLSSLLSTDLLSAAFGNEIGQLFGFSSGSDDNTNTTSTATTSGSTTVSSNAALGEKIAAEARTYVGKIPYVWGGTSLTSGADCSGFTQAIMKKFGISIPRTAAQQASSSDTGATIDQSSAKAGDLIYFQNTGNRSGVTHTGIMVGPDEFVHAQSSKTGVVETKLSSSNYNKKLYSIRRPQALQGSGSGLISSSAQRNNITSTHYQSNPVTFGNGSEVYVENNKQSNNINKAKQLLNKVSSGNQNILSNDEMIKLIKTIVTLLTSVSSNTEKLNIITELLTTYFSNNANTKDTSNKSINSSSSKSKVLTKDVENSTNDLIDILNRLATN